VRALAAGHLAEVRAKIADLRAMERVLADAHPPRWRAMPSLPAVSSETSVMVPRPDNTGTGAG
jgi:hypothetical protein